MQGWKADLFSPFPQTLYFDLDLFAASASQNLHARIPTRRTSRLQVQVNDIQKGFRASQTSAQCKLSLDDISQCTSEICSVDTLQVPEPASDVSAAQWFPVDDLPALEGVQMHPSSGSMESLSTFCSKVTFDSKDVLQIQPVHADGQHATAL